MLALLPNFQLRAYSAQRITALVQVLTEDGLTPAQVLTGSELDESALRLPDTRVSYQQMISVFRNALQLAPDPTVALRAGARMHVTAYGMWGYALLSSSSLAEVMDLSIKYRGVIGPLALMSFDGVRRPDLVAFEPLLTPDPSDALYRFATEFTLAAHLTLTGDLYGSPLIPRTIRVAYPEPVHAGAYATLLGCAAQFGQRGNELEHDPAWTQWTPRMHNGSTHAMARQTCAQFLQDLEQSSGTAALVRRTLVEQMPWRFPNINAMAEALLLHPRTLRRRLEAEGTAYRHVLADVRKRLAIGYLRGTGLSTEEIAARLGYSEAANFRHAFARWTGRSPHEYRAHQNFPSDR